MVSTFFSKNSENIFSVTKILPIFMNFFVVQPNCFCQTKCQTKLKVDMKLIFYIFVIQFRASLFSSFSSFLRQLILRRQQTHSHTSIFPLARVTDLYCCTIGNPHDTQIHYQPPTVPRELQMVAHHTLHQITAAYLCRLIFIKSNRTR